MLFKFIFIFYCPGTDSRILKPHRVEKVIASLLQWVWRSSLSRHIPSLSSRALPSKFLLDHGRGPATQIRLRRLPSYPSLFFSGLRCLAEKDHHECGQKTENKGLKFLGYEECYMRPLAVITVLQDWLEAKDQKLTRFLKKLYYQMNGNLGGQSLMLSHTKITYRSLNL